MQKSWFFGWSLQRKFDQRTAVLACLFPTVGILILNGLWTKSVFEHSAVAYWALDAVSHFIIPLVALYLLAKFYRISPRDYGFTRLERTLGLLDLAGLTLLVGAMFWISYIPVSATLGRLLGSELSSFTYFNVLPETSGARVLVAVYFAISAGVFEEIMYRSLPWVYFSMLNPRRPHIISYALISSVLFGFAHWENGLHEVFATFALGFVACVLYVKIRNIWPFVIAHSWIDLTAFW